MAGQVLGIDCWSPGFSPSSKIGSITLVWIRFPGLPMYCWGGKSLARIAGFLGEPVWMDAATERMERGLFTRVCVRVDLSLALKPGVWLDGPYGSFFQHVEYEGLSSFCFKCGQVGHKALSCQEGGAKTGGIRSVKGKAPLGGGEVPADGGGSGVDGREQISIEDEGVVKPAAKELEKDGGEGDGALGFGHWMLVQRRKRLVHNVRKGVAMGKGLAFSGSHPVGGKQAFRRVQDRGPGFGIDRRDPSIGKASSSGWAQRSWPAGRVGGLEGKGIDLGTPSSVTLGGSQVDLAKVGLKPFSGFKARSEVASLGPILDEDRRKRKKSSCDGEDSAPLVHQ